MPRKTLSFAMVLLIFNSPFLILAQENSDAAQAVMDARKDVKLSRTGEYWAFGTFLTSIACGCIGGSIILISSQLYTPTPPTSRLIGKSSEYITFYTQTYQQEMKKCQGQASIAGCIGGSAVAAALAVTFDLYDFNNLR